MNERFFVPVRFDAVMRRQAKIAIVFDRVGNCGTMRVNAFIFGTVQLFRAEFDIFLAESPATGQLIGCTIRNAISYTQKIVVTCSLGAKV